MSTRVADQDPDFDWLFLTTTNDITRRRFFKVAGLSAAGLATSYYTDAFGNCNAGPSCQDVAQLRQSISNADQQLESILAQVEAAGLDFSSPTPPIPEAQVELLLQQAKSVVISLEDQLRPYPREVLEQLYDPAFTEFVNEARAYNVPLIRTHQELQTYLFVPVSFVGEDFQSLGYIIGGLVLAAATGIELTDLRAVLTNGFIESIITLIEGFVKAITKGEFKAAKEFLKALLAKMIGAIKKLVGNAWKNILEKLTKKLGAGFFAFALFLIELIRQIYKNWDEVKRHLP